MDCMHDLLEPQFPQVPEDSKVHPSLGLDLHEGLRSARCSCPAQGSPPTNQNWNWTEAHLSTLIPTSCPRSLCTNPWEQQQAEALVQGTEPGSGQGKHPRRALVSKRPSWPPQVDQQSHQHATQAHGTLPGSGTQHVFRPASSDREQGSRSASPSGAASHIQTSAGPLKTPGVRPSLPPALCAPRARSALSTCKWFLISRGYVVTRENDRRLTFRGHEEDPLVPTPAASRSSGCSVARRCAAREASETCPGLYGRHLPTPVQSLTQSPQLPKA